MVVVVRFQPNYKLNLFLKLCGTYTFSIALVGCKNTRGGEPNILGRKKFVFSYRGKNIKEPNVIQM